MECNRWGSYRDRLHNLLLMRFGSGAIELPHNVRHPRFVSDECSQMARLFPVIWRKRFDVATATRGLLSRQKGEGSVSRGAEFTMRHCSMGFDYFDCDIKTHNGVTDDVLLRRYFVLKLRFLSFYLFRSAQYSKCPNCTLTLVSDCAISDLDSQSLSLI